MASTVLPVPGTRRIAPSPLVWKAARGDDAGFADDDVAEVVVDADACGDDVGLKSGWVDGEGDDGEQPERFDCQREAWYHGS